MIVTKISEWRRASDDVRRERLAGPDAAAWIEALARYGFAEAQTWLGQLLLDRRPPPPRGIAFGWFAVAAKAGHPPALNMMGRCLEHGWDCDPDPVAAVRCYREAAAAGEPWAQYNLGCALLYGIGGPRDRPAAFEPIAAAAAAGLAKAMNLLGRFHEEGWDRRPSRPEAARWYRAAAEQGEYRGLFNLASLSHRAGRRTEAIGYLRTAVERGCPAFLREAAALLADNDDPALRDLAAEATRRSIAGPPPLSNTLPGSTGHRRTA